jgi:phosphatidylglycerophosphate synthase
VLQDRTRNRRPLASRRLSVMRSMAKRLAATGLSPNQISFAGIVFSGGAAAAFLNAPTVPLLWFVAAGLIQLRLLANLLDGLVAVEEGRGSPTGPLWNEMPDRIEDTLIIVGFAHAIGQTDLGIWTALAAVGCAYVRMLGGALGQQQDFAGPMAKQHRMAALTIGCAIAFVESLAGAEHHVAGLLLWVVLAGTLVTIVRRTLALAHRLRNAE